jgi:hypothetical protein
MGYAAKKVGTHDLYWSPELTVASGVYSTAAHIQIIRCLGSSGPSSRDEIADITGLSLGLTGQCLNKLKSAGVVTIASNQPNVRTYALEADRARHLFKALECYLSVEDYNQGHGSRSAIMLPFTPLGRGRAGIGA